MLGNAGEPSGRGDVQDPVASSKLLGCSAWAKLAQIQYFISHFADVQDGFNRRTLPQGLGKPEFGNGISQGHDPKMGSALGQAVVASLQDFCTDRVPASSKCFAKHLLGQPMLLFQEASHLLQQNYGRLVVGYVPQSSHQWNASFFRIPQAESASHFRKCRARKPCQVDVGTWGIFGVSLEDVCGKRL